MREIFTSLLITAMIVAASIYTNPPNIRCTLVDNKKECVSIGQEQKTETVSTETKTHP